jgi:hypothetical protein
VPWRPPRRVAPGRWTLGPIVGVEEEQRKEAAGKERRRRDPAIYVLFLYILENRYNS